MHTCSHFVSGTYGPSQLCRRHHTRNRGYGRKTQFTAAQHATVTAQPRSTNGQLSPHQKIAKAFAPATIANLGPGFDWMGCAVEGEGDVVIAEAMPDLPGGEVVIKSIIGDDGRLPLVAANNCVGIAAIETIKLLGDIECGVALTLIKGLPLGSGMGSSAASAAAGAVAVNALFGSPLSKEELILPGLASEATVSGYHADNIAPALLGGFVLVRGLKPLDVRQLLFAKGDLYFVLVNPKFEAPTAEMRAVLPKMVPMLSAINNSAMGGSLVAGILIGDAALVGQSLDSDVIIEPVRGPLIPGFAAVKAAAKAAGAFGCTISGAGPTCVAVVDNPQLGQTVAEAMVKAFEQEGKLEVNSARVVRLDQQGARTI
ncbi:TPA: hypothetical protein ACH3X1_003132 [Trebouxia sp. C0004]